MDVGTLRRHLKLGPRLSRAWQEMEQITIAAIEGFCIGGGVAFAVALDFRIMASRSLWYRGILRLCFLRVVGVHMATPGLCQKTTWNRVDFRPLSSF